MQGPALQPLSCTGTGDEGRSVRGAPSSPAAGLPHAILQIIKELQEDIMELQRGIQRLRWDLRDPREVIFADVLLRKPR